MRLPADLPEYVEKVIVELETRADNLLRKNPDTSKATGYYAAVADLKELLETEAKMEDGARRQRLRAIVHGE